MMKVYVVNVKTESCDTYIWVYSYEPTDEEVIKRLMDIEGFDYDDPENGYQWFVDTTSVYIGETDTIDRV